MATLKLAFRTLAKTPFVTAIAVLSLALGIGANAAIFSMFDQVLLSSLPVRQPEQLVNLSSPGPKPGSQSCNDAGGCDEVFSYAMFRDLERPWNGIEGVAAHRLFGANLAFGGQTQSGQGMLVSGSYFPLLGVRPALGRLFGPEDDRTIGGHDIVVLSHGYWQNRLGGDPSVLNQAIVINGRPMTVVGVAQRGFEGTTLGSRPHVFVPISMRGWMSSGFEAFDDRRNYWVYVFARLKPGITSGQAAAEFNSLYRNIINEVEAPLQEGMSEPTMEQFRAKEITLADGRQGQSDVHREAGTPLTLLLAITGFVLLIACANIANLLLARGALRGTEMAIRGSLGASRLHLLKPLLTESLLLSVLGGVASLLVAAWTLRLIQSILPPDATDLLSFELSPAMLVFAAVLSIGTGFLFGLYPALHNTRRDLVTALRASAGQPSGARSAARFRTLLVTAQIALSMSLLVAAGLFIKSLDNISRIDLGLRADNIVTFSISPQLNGYESQRIQALFERIYQELEALPGVTSVSAAMVPLLGGSNWGTSVSVEGFERGPDIDNSSRFNAVGPAYFSTVGTPLLGGREFDRSDDADAPGVVIINEAFARKFGLDPRQAVGKRMARGSTNELNLEIVGVVKDAKYSEVKQVVPPLFFRPHRQDEDLGFLFFYARTGIEAEEIQRAIPGMMRKIDPNLPVDDLKTLQQQVDENIELDRAISILASAFAVLATLLAAIGLYGVLAYTVAQRTREFGLRMALGARGSRILRLVLAQVGRITLLGGVLGIAAALALGRGAQSLLFGLDGHDPLVFAAAALALFAVAFGAGYLPARRAAKVDPMQALRYE